MEYKNCEAHLKNEVQLLLAGLFLSEEQQDDSNNITSENYGDYRDVNGIKFPFNINTPSQKIELNITEILINEELKDSDF